MMDTRMIVTLVIAIVLCVVVGIVYFRMVTSERSGKKHAGSVDAAPDDQSPAREKGANAAFLRKLRTAVARRGLTMLQTDPAKSPFAALIVGPHGITAVYAVDYDGTIYGGDEKEWVQMKDGLRRTFENPLHTAETARRALRETVNQGNFRPFMIDARVVMTAQKAELAIPRSIHCYTPKTFNTYVMDSSDLANDRKVDEEKLGAFLREHFC
ncbi:MAG TPA: NERD domain-containing protein [Candidatus Gemmiger faecigallinarum]|nr:NERD domain-containing protein [Candidatus Gemmiger faecigallinarum]